MGKKFHYAWVILLGVSLIRGFAGPAINGSSGLFLTPVAESLGVGIGTLSIYLSVASVVSVLWLPVAGNLIARTDVRKIGILGALLQILAFAAMGLMTSVWGWYLLAIPTAMGATLLVNLLGPVLIGRWFGKKKGLVMGLMMTATSLLGAVFQPVLTGLIAGQGWRRAYLIFGGVALVAVVAVTLLLLRSAPGEMGLLPYGEEGHSPQAAEEAVAMARQGVDAARATQSLPFYLLLFYMMVLAGFAVFAQHITTYGLSLGFPMERIGGALALSMVGSAIGSILIGLSSDRVGIIPTSLGVLGAGLLSIALYAFGGDSFGVYAAATFLHGLATSAIGVVAPLLTTSFFGQRDYEKLFSRVMMGAPLASILLVPAYGFVYDATGSYRLVFFFLLGLLLLGGFSLFIGKRKSRSLWAAE